MASAPLSDHTIRGLSLPEFRFSNRNVHSCFLSFGIHRKCRPVARASSSSAVPSIDLGALESALSKKDSNAVKEALDQLSEAGWAKKWGSQSYVSRRTTSLLELTTLGIKNAENLAIASVRNDAAFLFTAVGTTGFSPANFLGFEAFPALFDWEHLVDCLGCWKHLARCLHANILSDSRVSKQECGRHKKSMN